MPQFNRIVSLSPSMTEILFALGVGERVVARTAFCDFPATAKRLPIVGSWTVIDDEKIKSFSPDLVCASTVVQKDSEARYRGAGFEVFFADPRTLDEVLRSILELGILLDRLDAARGVVRGMQNRFAQIRRASTLKNGMSHPWCRVTGCQTWCALPAANHFRWLAVLSVASLCS